MNKINKTKIDEYFFFIKVKDLIYTFCDIGASIYSIYFFDTLLTLTPSKKEEFINSPQYFGKTLGLVAGRIKSKFNYLNKEFNFKETNPNLTLHGGHLTSISFSRFTHKIKEYKNKIDVIFFLKPRKNENGFNGKVHLKITYSLNKLKNEFKIKEEAFIKEDSFLNLSNHIYWNLGNSLNINCYYLKFDAPSIGEMNDDLLIINKINTPKYLNFKRKARLESRLNIASKLKIGTIDNTFLFNKENKINKCLLETSKYKLKLKTNYPAMNIYCDSSLSPVLFLNRTDLKERRAIALEPQLFNLDLDSIYFKKGTKYSYFIDYEIIKK